MGKIKINRQQLPVKAHFFFFMAAMGPILPFLPVYGKQLGVSPLVMGSITSILPLFFLIAKPAFGFLVDRFRNCRRIIFLGLLFVTSGCYVLMYFLPALPGPTLPVQFQNASCADLTSCVDLKINITDSCLPSGRSSNCAWSSRRAPSFTNHVFFAANDKATLSKKTSCLLDGTDEKCQMEEKYNVTCEETETESACVYSSVTFWGFVLLMALGTIGFNVSNSISDAICFDVLGEGGQMSYGRQRVWGSIGFGIAAFMAGYAVDWWSGSDAVKTYTPAFLLVSSFTIIDLACCSKVELPIISGTESILKDVWKLLKIKPILIFICFATIVGIIDSFLIYFLFWYIEDLAEATGYMNEIKFIEGLTVFAQTLGGEIIFFSLSGKILKKIGYGYSFVFCFMSYALRLSLISLAATPHWIVLVELFMQGPSYALCYTTIVAYASAVAPPGTSATVQGIVAGMDDGLGFAIGSLAGGVLYKEFGGVTTMRIYATLAVLSAAAYLMLHVIYLKHKMPETDVKKITEWKNPEEALKACTDANNQ